MIRNKQTKSGLSSHWHHLPKQTLHFVVFSEVQQHLTLFLVLWRENLFGVIFYHSNEQKVVRLYLLTLKRVNSSEHCISQGAGRLLWGFPCHWQVVSSLAVILNMVSSGELDVMLVSSGELCISRVGGGTPCQFWSVSWCNLGLGLCVRQSHA